jgi:hypothetical protein
MEIENTKAFREQQLLSLGWIQLAPGKSVEIPAFTVPTFNVGRALSLNDARGQETLFDVIRNHDVPLLSPKIRAQPESLHQALSYFLPKVDSHWANISSLGVAVLKEGPKRLVGFATEEILNLAYALWCCRTHSDIDRLFKKLQSDHLRGSLIEVQIATNLIRAGHSIRVEPNLSNDTRSSDIHLDLDGQRKLIESKRPRISMQKHAQRCNQIQQSLQGKLIRLPDGIDPEKHKIDILLKTRMPDNQIPEAANIIKGALTPSSIGVVSDFPDFSVCLRTPEMPTPFASKSFMGNATVAQPGMPVPAFGGPIFVSIDAARGEFSLMSRLIGDAKRQIAAEIALEPNAKGVIVIEYAKSDIVIAAAMKRLALDEYSHIQAIITSGDDPQILPRSDADPFPVSIAQQMLQALGW